MDRQASIAEPWLPSLPPGRNIRRVERGFESSRGAAGEVCFQAALASMTSLLRFLRWFARAADAVVDAVGRVGAWLVLFVVAALFGQLPLREWVGAGHLL